MRGLRRLMVGGLVVPLAAAFAFCALASFFPFRLDRRALQDMVALQDAGLHESDGGYVFLSADNSIESARKANFGLRPMAFPQGTVWWATLQEKSNGVWWSGFVSVDPVGMAYRARVGPSGSWQWQPAPDAVSAVQGALARARVVYDSPLTRELFEQRWPFLVGSPGTELEFAL